VVAAKIRCITSNTAPVRVNNEIWAEINIRILLNNHQIHGFEVRYMDLVNPLLSETLTLEKELRNVLTSRTEEPAEDSSSSQLGIAAVGGRADGGDRNCGDAGGLTLVERGGGTRARGR
jgi:hypothetical protein